MKRVIALCLAMACVLAQAATINASTPRLVLTAFDYSGWAVCSLKLDGIEYIDARDHGRCLQSAASFDFMGEAFNPTEGGSANDWFLPFPSSTITYTIQGGLDHMATEVEAAFWHGGRSHHIIRKYLIAGYGGRNITEHRIGFEIPANESHSMGQFEILTGYMPSRFATFRTYNPATGALASVTDGPGEQALPLIFCSDDAHCMGAYSPLALVGGGYGRWRFADCVKWNMVARFANPAGTFRFRVFTTVGTLAEVEANLTWLIGK